LFRLLFLSYYGGGLSGGCWRDEGGANGDDGILWVMIMVIE
jgi:hypothetical protein